MSEYPRRWAALAVLSLTLVAVTLDNSVLNTALPSLAHGLHATTSDLQWITDAYSECVCPDPRGFSDIQLKGQVAALMFPDFDIVQPDFGKVIHCAKAKDKDTTWLQPFHGNFKLTLIPCLAILIAKTRVCLPW